MKYALMLTLATLFLACGAFEVHPYGPDAAIVYHANFQDVPSAVAGTDLDGHICLYLDAGTVWIPHPHWISGLPVTGILKLNDNTMMVTLGAGTYSDGLYDLNLSTQEWTVNDWFVWPAFILRCAANDQYYLGEITGLNHSANGSDWTHISALGQQSCTAFAGFGGHLVTNNGNIVYYSDDAGLSWQQSSMPNLSGFRFASSGDLYAFMAVESDSDGLWRSHDFGATWELVFYSSNLCAIGPDFEGALPLGWNQANENGNYLELLLPDGQRTPFNHPALNSGVRQLELFPLVNTPAFFVVNAAGLHFVTNFSGVENDEDLIPVPDPLRVTLHPNPAASFVNLVFEGKTPAVVELSLYDLRGRKLYSRSGLAVHDNRLGQSLPALPNGIYLLKIDAGDKVLSSRLLILR